MCPSLNKYSLTCKVTARYVLYETYPEPCLGKFHNLIKIFSHIVAYLEPCITVTCSKSCLIQNPGIFKTWDTFRTLSKHALAYSEHCATLATWELFHTENFAIFRVLVCLGPSSYSESCLFRHISAYSTMILITN